MVLLTHEPKRYCWVNNVFCLQITIYCKLIFKEPLSQISVVEAFVQCGRIQMQVRKCC